MLINSEKCRKSNVSRTIIDFIRENPDILEFHDQDAINANMWNKWLNIPFKYNYMTSLIDKHPINYNELDGNILIVHYTRLKPRNYLCKNPFKKKYFYYLAKTPWKDKKFIDKTFKNMVIKLFEFAISFFFPKNMIKNLRKFILHR